MAHRFRATGLNPTPAWVWVHYTDSGLAVPRRHAVQVPWGLVLDKWPDLSHGADKEWAKRLEAESERSQPPLPLETWE